MTKRADLVQRNAEHETEIWLLVNEVQARALMVGEVPEAIRDMARAAVDWEWELAKRGSRRDDALPLFASEGL